MEKRIDTGIILTVMILLITITIYKLGLPNISTLKFKLMIECHFTYRNVALDFYAR